MEVAISLQKHARLYVFGSGCKLLYKQPIHVRPVPSCSHQHSCVLDTACVAETVIETSCLVDEHVQGSRETAGMVV